MALGNMISSFLNPEKGYEKAEDAAKKYYIDAQGQLQPIIQHGSEQFARLNQQAGALNDPVNLENKWAGSYSMSPYATDLFNEAKSSGLDAASSAGLLGSSATLNNVQNTAGKIMNSDRQSYMNDLMQKYMASIGIGQNIYGLGASASGMGSENAMNQGTTMANLEFGRQNAPGSMLSKILGATGGAALNYATGGMSSGLPVNSAVNSGVNNAFAMM